MSAAMFEQTQGPAGIDARSDVLFSEQWQRRLAKVDRMFAVLMGCQWIFGILDEFR